jgi:transcription elongation GreA/GreB family factor
MRALELRNALAEVQSMPVRAFQEGQPVALGALVAIEEEGATQMLFLAPHGGGARLAEGFVQVVTPKSPLGHALLGKCVGDECDVRLAGRTRSLVLSRVE